MTVKQRGVRLQAAWRVYDGNDKHGFAADQSIDEHDLAAGQSLGEPGTDLGAVFYGLMTIVLAWLIGRAVNLAIHHYLDRVEKSGADPTGIRFLGKLARVGIYITALVFYAHLVPQLDKLGTALLAGVGVASVVIGLAAQSTLGNLIAGISLILYRPFKIGDRVQVSAPTGQETGVVISIDLGYTVLRTADQRFLVIPNSIIASQASLNLSLTPLRTPCGVSLYVGGLGRRCCLRAADSAGSGQGASKDRRSGRLFRHPRDGPGRDPDAGRRVRRRGRRAGGEIRFAGKRQEAI